MSKIIKLKTNHQIKLRGKRVVFNFITLKLEISKHEEASHIARNNFEYKPHGISKLSFLVATSIHLLW